MLYKSIEGAVVLCKMRGNPVVRLEHWLKQILETPGNDIQLILEYFEIPEAALKHDLEAAISGLPGGSAALQDIDYMIDSLIERAWLYATLMFRTGAIRSGHLLVASLKTAWIRKALVSIAPQLARVETDKLTELFYEVVSKSIEGDLAAHDGSPIGVSNSSFTRDLFISYRRSESQHLTGRIFDHLEQAIGPERVFKDVNAIPIGTRDFAEEIRSQIKSSKLMVAIIGPQWLTVRDDAGRRRIDDKDDFVRIEIKWALEMSVPIVPILFDDAAMPTASELPVALRALSRCQAMRVRVDPDFRNDIKTLIDVCRRLLDKDKPPAHA